VRNDHSLCGCGQNTQPFNWEADTLSLSHHRLPSFKVHNCTVAVQVLAVVMTSFSRVFSPGGRSLQAYIGGCLLHTVALVRYFKQSDKPKVLPCNCDRPLFVCHKPFHDFVRCALCQWPVSVWCLSFLCFRLLDTLILWKRWSRTTVNPSHSIWSMTLTLHVKIIRLWIFPPGLCFPVFRDLKRCGSSLVTKLS